MTRKLCRIALAAAALLLIHADSLQAGDVVNDIKIGNRSQFSSRTSGIVASARPQTLVFQTKRFVQSRK